MTGTSASPSHQVMQQAAEWFALLRSGEATERDRKDWSRWFDGALEHREAWGYIEQVAQRFAPIAETQARRPLIEAYRSSRVRRRQVVSGLLGMATFGVLGPLAWRELDFSTYVMSELAAERTAIGEVRQTSPPDGTRIWLNTDTALNTEYTSHLRLLQLVAGEILVETAPDTRALVVETAHGRLRALGTRFTVMTRRSETLLAVYKGAVEARAATGGEPIVIPAGRQLRFDRGALLADEPADPAREAWSRGVLLAHDIPLSELVREMQRYRKDHLHLDPAVAKLRVLGSYPIADPDRALRMLESVLPIVVRRAAPWWTVIESRPAAAT